MIFLSSNQFSVDDQTADVISWLSNEPGTAQLMEERFNSEFPEYNNLIWEGSWVDTENSDVDADYMNFVRDWIKEYTDVTWWEGEPVIFEESDKTDEDFDSSWYKDDGSYLDPRLAKELFGESI